MTRQNSMFRSERKTSCLLFKYTLIISMTNPTNQTIAAKRETLVNITSKYGDRQGTIGQLTLRLRLYDAINYSA